MQSLPDYMTDFDRAAYDFLLSVWRDFMRTGDHSGDYDHKSPCLQSDGAKDSEQLYSQADFRLYQATDACIDSLVIHERVAINVANGQARVFRFPRLDPAKTLMEAEVHLLALLKKNSCTAVKF